MSMAAGQTVTPPSPPVGPDLPVSIERIRDALERPILKIPPIEITPVFRARADEFLFENPVQGMRRELAESSGYTARGGVDVLGLVMGIVQSIKATHRASTEARIRREVEAELTAFCAEHDCSVLEDGPPPMEGIVLPRQTRSH
jgi:hypothetical protein